MTPQKIRRTILEQSKRANVGHIGSALCVVDILVALYAHIMKIPDPKSNERDRFILSKGHAALALYSIFHAQGWITTDDLNSYCGNASKLGVHPEHCVDGVDFSTGSLGQGLGYGAGAALAAKMQGSQRNVYVLVSDAECNEGALWEAAMFAAHHQLANLWVIVDDNKQQALGYTKDVLSLNPMAQRWRAFGWNTIEVDGHNIEEMVRVMKDVNVTTAPHVMIAHTCFAKGVSFMENKIEWHYLPMSDAQYCQALIETEGNHEKSICENLVSLS